MTASPRRGVLSLAAGLLLAASATGCAPLRDTFGGQPSREAQWALDPEAGVGPDDTEIPLLVQEVSCASGQDATGRVTADVAYGDTEVTVVVRVRVRPGDQDCQGNPLTPYVLALDEPLGDRTLVNGAADEIARRPIEGLVDDPGVDGGGSGITFAEDVPERVAFIAEALVARARDASELGDMGDLSLDPAGVDLYVGLLRKRTVDPADLASPDAWVMQVAEGYAEFSGPFSALASLGGAAQVQVRMGAQPHCAGPPRPAPEGHEDDVRVAIEPTAVDSCIDWFVVNLYLGDTLQVRAIQLDLFGP